MSSNMSANVILRHWPKFETGGYKPIKLGDNVREWRMAKNGLWYFYRGHRIWWGSGDLRLSVNWRIRASTMFLRGNGNIHIRFILQHPAWSDKSERLVFPCIFRDYILKPQFVQSGSIDRLCVRRSYAVFTPKKNKLQLVALGFDLTDMHGYSSVLANRLYNKRFEPKALIGALPPEWIRKAPVKRDGFLGQLRFEISRLDKQMNEIELTRGRLVDQF